ncbi:diacylglycerol kinase family protein [Candidatus Kaiserbacteria bacterium]|nr:diacylglycerol kinase family protein [Candidatus Kaiserbacteria bacterium]
MLDRKVNSLRNALAGLVVAWKEELNFRIQIGCGITALIAAWVLGVSTSEFLIIIFLIGFVLSAEALNTALEEFCDMVQRNPDPHIAKIKDLAAAAVLIASFTALIVGAAIFIPHLSLP